MILVTGATGRIGNVLVKELNKKVGRVKVFLREKSSKKALEGCDCEYIYGDILDISSIERCLENIEAVFHLAGHISISEYEKDLTLNTNIQGTKNIADLCLKHNIPLVYTSSIHAIRPPENGGLITEDTPLSTDFEERRGIYDYSKACATQYVLDLQKKGLQVIIVHPTGVIGPYDYNPSYFGAGMISLVKGGIKVTIGGAYDYVDVRDVVGAMLKAYDLKKYGQRYILSGEVLTMKEYIEYLKEFENVHNISKVISYKLSLFLGGIASFFNRKSPITPYSVKTLYSNCNISHEKATKELGYMPLDIKESLRDQYVWFKENGYFN